MTLTSSPVELDLHLPSGRLHAQRFGSPDAPRAERLTIIGHSMGGAMVALAAALPENWRYDASEAKRAICRHATCGQ